MAKQKFSYREAVTELQAIVAELNEGKVEIDDLQSKVKRARQLLESCKKKLRATEKEIDELLG